MRISEIKRMRNGNCYIILSLNVNTKTVKAIHDYLIYLGFTFPHYITTMHKNNIRIESPDENKIKKAIEFLKLHL